MQVPDGSWAPPTAGPAVPGGSNPGPTNPVPAPAPRVPEELSRSQRYDSRGRKLRRHHNPPKYVPDQAGLFPGAERNLNDGEFYLICHNEHVPGLGMGQGWASLYRSETYKPDENGRLRKSRARHIRDVRWDMMSGIVYMQNGDMIYADGSVRNGSIGVGRGREDMMNWVYMNERWNWAPLKVPTGLPQQPARGNPAGPRNPAPAQARHARGGHGPRAQSAGL